MKFPEDFTVENHQIVQNAKQWLLKKDNEIIISIVGGGYGLYGNGIDTFEMWDYREYQPKTYLTKDEINTHLQKYPII